MANKKITIAEQFAEVEKFLRENGKETMANFIAERCELHTKKNSSKSSKPTKAQEENEGIKTNIVNEMVKGERYTVSEMLTKLPCCEGYTNQKISALVRQLVAEGELARVEEKGKAYFTLAQSKKKVEGFFKKTP